MNVAYHLRQLGANPVLVTAVGKDELGNELIRRLKSWGVAVQGVLVRPTKPTGLARVEVVDGNPQFEIVANVAWDWIELQPAVLERAQDAGAVVFGSLAQRTEYNRQALAQLLRRAARSFKVFDVNLRAPYDLAERVWSLTREADLIKLNEQELSRLLDRNIPPEDLANAARQFAERAEVPRVCVTAGARGAGLLLKDEWLWESGRAVPVRDSVGAGDAFLAALLLGLLRRTHPPVEILRRACRLAEFVVSQDGATPAYRGDEPSIWVG